MSILVTGAAGYIGSVTTHAIYQAGRRVVALDNLQRGQLSALPAGVPFYRVDVGDVDAVSAILRKHDIRLVLHFAAFAYVRESVLDPARYYENNVVQGLRFLDSLVKNKVQGVVFSSSCATYGTAAIPIAEDHPQQPVNPYGWTKLVFERALDHFGSAYHLRSVILRYFNAAGATATHGENHDPETHLIPRMLSVALGARDRLTIYGRDFPTRDGTAIRDYVHVQDLAAAHTRAIDYLREGGPSVQLNLGTGQGHSILDVLRTAERVTKADIPVEWAQRRAEDPPALVAEAAKAREVLGWRPACSDMNTIISSAWEWLLKQARGSTIHRGPDAAEKAAAHY